MATECSRNDGSKTQYYLVILDRLRGHSGGLERALESRVRGPLTTLDFSMNFVRTCQIYLMTNSTGMAGSLC